MCEKKIAAHSFLPFLNFWCVWVHVCVCVFVHVCRSQATNAGMVVVPKPDEHVQLCGDFTNLNLSVRRERHLLPSIEHLLADVHGAKYFTKLDANSGFHQIPLDRSSQLLTTFITPAGRYCYKRLPFGISSALEHFQKRMTAILDGCPGLILMMDDILIFGTTPDEHERLITVLRRLAKAGVTLNRAKCIFGKTQVRFCGYLLDATGIRPDPAKITALVDMPPCKNMSNVRRFLGMANQLGRFSSSAATLSQPLRGLLVKGNAWLWDTAHQTAFENIKADLCSATVLAMYSPSSDTCAAADASSFVLGAVITQLQPNGEWRPIAFQSRSMTPTEQRYSQIEKEALAATWACERFSHYLVGLPFRFETDHKPLVPLLSTKRLDELPPRIIRFRLRLMRYSFTIHHVPGKDLVTADALSRVPVHSASTAELALQADVDGFVALTTDSLPATDQRLRRSAARGSVCNQLITYCAQGWPSHDALPDPLKHFWPSRGDLTLTHNNMLLNGSRIVVPAPLRLATLKQLHHGHKGISKCRQRAYHSVWWSGLSAELQAYTERCSTCIRQRKQHAEPLLPTPLPALPWQKGAADFLDFNGKTYLVVVDCYSKYIEVAMMNSTTTASTTRKLRQTFARHGLPDELVSDNGPQFASPEFSSFFPQSNGMAKRAVQTAKRLLRSSTDPDMALLAYRATPLENGFSPAELLFSRRVRTTVPLTLDQRRPTVPDIRARTDDIRQRQVRNFNTSHRARNLPALPPGTSVYLPDRQEDGHVVNSPTTRWYIVSTPSGDFRRNCRHIHALPPSVPATPQPSTQQPSTAPSRPPAPEDRQAKHEHGATSLPPPPEQPPKASAPATSRREDGLTVTRSGRISRPPNKLNL